VVQTSYCVWGGVPGHVVGAWFQSNFLLVMFERLNLLNICACHSIKYLFFQLIHTSAVLLFFAL